MGTIFRRSRDNVGFFHIREVRQSLVSSENGDEIRHEALYIRQRKGLTKESAVCFKIFATINVQFATNERTKLLVCLKLRVSVSEH